MRRCDGVVLVKRILHTAQVLASGLRPAVVSQSLGSSGNSRTLIKAIAALVNAGVAVVVAASNNNDSGRNKLRARMGPHIQDYFIQKERGKQIIRICVEASLG